MRFATAKLAATDLNHALGAENKSTHLARAAKPVRDGHRAGQSGSGHRSAVLWLALARSEVETVGDLLKASPFGLGRRFTKQVPEPVRKQWASQPAPKIPGGLKFFLIPFFIVHYSGFMGVHLVFILVLLGPGKSLIGQTGVSPSSLFDFGFDTWELASLAIALISLVIEHGYSFYKDFWLSGEYRRAIPAAQMFAPYPRIVVLHVAILFGAFLFVFFGLPPLMVVLLVTLKVGLELRNLPRAKVSGA